MQVRGIFRPDHNRLRVLAGEPRTCFSGRNTRFFSFLNRDTFTSLYVTLLPRLSHRRTTKLRRPISPLNNNECTPQNPKGPRLPPNEGHGNDTQHVYNARTVAEALQQNGIKDLSQRCLEPRCPMTKKHSHFCHVRSLTISVRIEQDCPQRGWC